MHCRQRFLYEEFMQSADTRNKLSSGNFLSIANVLMQLRKVCNHPDLFEARPIESPFDMSPALTDYVPSLVVDALDYDQLTDVDMGFLNLRFIDNEHMSSWQAERVLELHASGEELREAWDSAYGNCSIKASPFSLALPHRVKADKQEKKERLMHLVYTNEWRCAQKPLFGSDLRQSVTISNPFDTTHIKTHSLFFTYPSYKTSSFASLEITETDVNDSDDEREMIYLKKNDRGSLFNLVQSYKHRAARLQNGIITNFTCIIPKVTTRPIELHCSHRKPTKITEQARQSSMLAEQISPLFSVYRPAYVRQQIYFPDKRLIQYDCGKLQELDRLLRILKKGGHKALIFTQMSRMLDVLETWINIHGYTYLRLDGATRPEQRQLLMERFNTDPRIFLFILSTRAGGIGINLTGADTVIFYDSDWNPAMDQQVTHAHT